ncbi:MAG: hypothetical protein ACM3SR_06560 [Ignavibacteriales bacterium]
MSKILSYSNRQLQERKLKIASTPSVDDLKVFENAIHNLARTGNREAVRRALQDYVELWKNKAERSLI